MLAAKRLQARVGAVYELDNAIEAIRHAMQVGDKRHGKVVVYLKHLQPASMAAAEANATPIAAATSVSLRVSPETSAPSAA
jgi:hypothetical protein